MRAILFGCVLLIACLRAAAQDDRDLDLGEVLRAKVLDNLFSEDDKSQVVADAYEQLFTLAGPAGLRELANDKDPSIALQAAWELHKKAVTRDPEIPGRTDWVFDKELLKGFLKDLAKHLKCEPPKWWSTTLINGEEFPGRHHAFVTREEPEPSTATMSPDGEDYVVTSGKLSVRMPKALLRHGQFDHPPVFLCGADKSFVARPQSRGYPFEVTGVESKTGKRLWTATVWAARRGFSSGPDNVCPIEIRRMEDQVLVFGCESHGIYAEGFDAQTGKCQFRFCSCYWFNFSESWGRE
jgi:hypothetical protein